MPPSPPTPSPDLKWGAPPGGALDKIVVGVSGGSNSGCDGDGSKQRKGRKRGAAAEPAVEAAPEAEAEAAV